MSLLFDPTTHPHRRYNPLSREYVLVSPHRTKRPWLGQTEAPPLFNLPKFDSTCYLCPGNKRSGGQQNPTYEDVHSFENDFAAILPGPGPTTPPAPHHLLTTQPVQGRCDVIIFHPRHDLTLARLGCEDIQRVIIEWKRIYELRGSDPEIKYVQIFENKGAMMGCSNPHPHGQAWSMSEIPQLPATELESLAQYAVSPHPATPGASKGPKGLPCLLCDYAQAEIDLGEADGGRVVFKNEHWFAVVPWWAIWPFEILLLPYKRHIPSLSHLTGSEISSFAEILSVIAIKYDNLFQTSFAYSMGVHQKPVPGNLNGDDAHDVAHLHLHFYPPLLRSATVRKFLVGFELMGEPQRDLTSEQAAQRLRDCADKHFAGEVPP
jgi:UDPglucose--hexose-1-phosphate uridylyltransferase